MFTFNKYDKIIVSKVIDYESINIKYINERTFDIYENDIYLKIDVGVIDDYDLFVKYMTELEIKQHSPKFERNIDQFSKYEIMKIIIPFMNLYKKESSDIILDLPKKYISHQPKNIYHINQKLIY